MIKANPYDKAHELARAVKGSDEMKELEKTWGEISRRPDHRRRMERFRQVSMEIQKIRMQGQEPRQEQGAELNRLMEDIRSDPCLRQYMEAESRFGRLMADITRILGEPLEEIHRGRS